MKELLIHNCSDCLMWYSSLVGQRVPFVRDAGDGYMSREPSGYLNIVKYEDADVVEAVKFYGQNEDLFGDGYE